MEKVKHKQTVKTVNKAGEEKVYCYDNKQYYENYKAKNPHCICDRCGALVLGLYLNKHQTSKKCGINAQIKADLLAKQN